MDIRPDELAPRDRYKLLIGAIVPRPGRVGRCRLALAIRLPGALQSASKSK
jgi:hypothetical protein